MELENNKEQLPFEAAMDKVGFGLYGYLLTCWTGVAIISFVCVGYGATIIVPTSACELATTSSQQGILAAGPVVGLMVGGVLWGYLADTRGRRTMLLVALAGAAIVNALASLSVNWVMLLVMNVISALFASGMYSMSMSLLSESVPIAKRNFVVLLVSSIFLLSQGLMAVLAMPVIPLSFSTYLPSLGIYWNSWRLLMVVYSLPSICTFICLFFLQESPKYVYSKGDTEQALEILRKIHRLSTRSKEGLQVKSLQKDERVATEGKLGSMRDQIVPLFKQPLLKYTVIMTLLMLFKQTSAFQIWLPTIADRFVDIMKTGEGTDMNMCAVINMDVDLPVDPDAVPCALNNESLLIVFGVAALQSLFNIIMSPLVNVVGRRNIVMIVTSVCGLSGLLVNVVPSAVGSAVLFAMFLNGIIVVGYYTAITVALFPTHLRALALALLTTSGRIATFASIQVFNLLLEVNCDAGFYIYSSMFAASAVIALFLPDDRISKSEDKTKLETTEDGLKQSKPSDVTSL